ncbi:HAD-like domain-containing protein, partial [Phycomyces blakesleeanus]
SPTREYLELANQRYHCLKTLSRKKQLLILDLNGTLVSRTGSKGMYVRPHQDEFVDYVFENFQVMVWSSAQPVNVDRMCRMFEDHRPELVKVWDRTYFGLTPNQYNKKIVTIKDLKRVWSAFDNGEYDATNTILLDDSPEKTVLQPYNSVHLTSFDHLSSTFRAHGESELLAVISYLEKLRKVDNVCSYIRERPY